MYVCKYYVWYIFVTLSQHDDKTIIFQELSRMVKEHKRDTARLTAIGNTLKEMDCTLKIKDLSNLLYLLAVLNLQDEVSVIMNEQSANYFKIYAVSFVYLFRSF